MKTEEFGLYLRNLRIDNNLSIRQLSERSGVSNAYLSHVENGKRNVPSPDILRRLAEQLDVPYNVMMEKAGYLYINKDKEIEGGGTNGMINHTLECLFEAFLNVGLSERDLRTLLWPSRKDSDYNEKDPFKQPYTAREKILKITPPYIKQAWIDKLALAINKITNKNDVVLVSERADNKYANRDDLSLDNIKSLSLISKPKDLQFNKDNFYLITIKDKSVVSSRIQPGDKVLIKVQTEDFVPGSVVLASYNGKLILRKVSLSDKAKIILLSDDLNEPSILLEESDCSILGKVVQVIFTLD
ncbi:helix-turn-helix domain-containing protein [Priestia megaterium]|uniref:helix-turn-helix domain-containing protein n=1 Tax=Priestia megaterium TaxID=1404 RepID=UPI001FB27385|nr:helix-turn-helix domain-containing protein [Priestia megaterium]